MKKSLSRALGSVAVSLWILSIAGTASATPFGGDSHRFSNLSLFSSSQFPGFSGSFTSIGSSGHTGVGFGRFDFVWTTDPAASDALDPRSERAREVLGNLQRLTRHVHNPRLGEKLFPVIRRHEKPGNGPVPAIPEPSAALIFTAGLAIAGYRRRS